MKYLKIILFGLAFGLFMLACKEPAKTEKSNDQSQSEVQASVEYTSAYVCPMHCEGSGSDNPGSCPICNMDYVALEEHKSDGHHHEEEPHEEHDNHNH